MSENFPGLTATDPFNSNKPGDHPDGARTIVTPIQQKSRRFFYFFIGTVFFFLFLLFKLPEAKIQNLLIAHIKIQAQNQGFSFNAEKVKVGMIFGPAIKLYNVEIKSLDDDKMSLTIPFLKIKPQLTSLPFPRKKMNLTIELAEGSLSGTIGVAPTSFLIDLTMKKINLAQISILKKYLFIDFKATLNGDIKLDLSSEKVDKSEGRINILISNIGVINQSLFGMQLPDLKISSAFIDVQINAGKYNFKEVRVGRDIRTDDLVGAITGEGALAPAIERSSINAKASFELSRKVKDKLPLLDSLLSSAKTSDGKFSYKLNGLLSTLEPQPGG